MWQTVKTACYFPSQTNKLFGAGKSCNEIKSKIKYSVSIVLEKRDWKISASDVEISEV